MDQKNTSNIAIRVENLSKRYRIGLKEEIHDTFAGAITSFVRSPLKNLKGLRRLSRFEEDGRDPEDVIWALKDVSFEVKRGEVLGIIGRNGAGKTTLLKILSKITYPTTGRVELHGRVSSLLEVGTGFHPELTGRENIYLNGTILGMTRKEIDCKFDEIVDFSGVEKFIDTPVKRYSSGMRVRLAFSVAAHLEPEILLVDEVLAVGDAEFQKKCVGKMDEVAKGGRTVLFVSHNMGTISNLCQEALLIKNGFLNTKGNVSDVINDYYSVINQDSMIVVREGNGRARTNKVLFEKNGCKDVNFAVFDDICIRLSIESFADIHDGVIGIKIMDRLRNVVFSTNTELLGKININFEKGKKYEAVFNLYQVPFKNGRYDLMVGIHPQKAISSKRNEYYDRVEDIAYFYINSDKNDYGLVNIESDFIIDQK